MVSENGQGPRPIHWAARNGHVAVVDILLSAGACPVDATDHKGLTPLMMACMFGRSLMAAYLLGRGAEPNLTDMNGDSALHWSAYKGFPALMQASDCALIRNIFSSSLEYTSISLTMFVFTTF